MPRTAEQIEKEDEDKVDIKDQTTEQQIDKPAAEEAKGPTPEEVAADLRKQLEASNARADREKAAREEAEANAAGAVNRQRASVQSEIATREAAIVSRIAAGTTKLDSIKQQLKQAKAAGDGDAEVELQDALTNARYQLNAAEWEQNQFNNWKTTEAQRQQTAQQGQQNASPYTKAEQAWIERHPEFASSKKFARLAKLAAQEAREDGIAQDSKAYFDYIEGALKEEGLIRGESDPTSGADETAGAASTAAAPNRNGMPGGVLVPSKNSKYPYLPKGFTIPKDWVEAAESQGYEGKEGALEYANDRLEIEQKEKGSR